MEYIYENTRPRLLVESGKSVKLGNCYYKSCYTVTSRMELNKDAFDALFETGAIGYGQAFYVVSENKFFDEVPCIGIDGDKRIENPINPYSGNPYGSTKNPYWVYKVETHCDSGD